jgi:hypothetical protein
VRFISQVIKQRLYHNHMLLPLSDNNLVDSCLNLKKRGEFILCEIFSKVNSAQPETLLRVLFSPSNFTCKQDKCSALLFIFIFSKEELSICIQKILLHSRTFWAGSSWRHRLLTYSSKSQNSGVSCHNTALCLLVYTKQSQTFKFSKYQTICHCFTTIFQNILPGNNKHTVFSTYSINLYI